MIFITYCRNQAGLNVIYSCNDSTYIEIIKQYLDYFYVLSTVPTERPESPREEVPLDISVTTEETPKPTEEEEVSYEIEETVDVTERPKEEQEEMRFDVSTNTES